ncbi:MAG: hypothetical protein ACK5EN_08030, partial [Planctomyces sp.]
GECWKIRTPRCWIHSPFIGTPQHNRSIIHTENYSKPGSTGKYRTVFRILSKQFASVSPSITVLLNIPWLFVA